MGEPQPLPHRWRRPRPGSSPGTPLAQRCSPVTSSPRGHIRDRRRGALTYRAPDRGRQDPRAAEVPSIGHRLWLILHTTASPAKSRCARRHPSRQSNPKPTWYVPTSPQVQHRRGRRACGLRRLGMEHVVLDHRLPACPVICNTAHIYMGFPLGCLKDQSRPGGHRANGCKHDDGNECNVGHSRGGTIPAITGGAE